MTFADSSIIVANFVERRSDRPNSTTTGTLYYYYDSSDYTKSRLRFEHTLPGDIVVSNLYHYKDGAIYSMCTDACTGILTTEGADPWYYDSNYYTQGTKEGSYYWFTRTSYTPSSDVGPQVEKILMGTSKTASADISKIVFADGRTLELSGVKLNPDGLTADNAKFSTDSSLDCPKATCPIYADMVFVLDNSGSVDSTEWSQSVTFVKSVMDSFTFGTDAVEAAIIQFNGGSTTKTCSKKTVNGCSKCSGDYTFSSSYSYPGYATATIVAGLDQGNGVTVSPDSATLQTVISGSRPSKYGNTCQGYGLQLAAKVFDQSPRRYYSKKPYNIVIAITDGVDMCPNKTADAAEYLRTNYDAFVVEIGVGLSSGCQNYDKSFLQRIASKIGTSDNAAYYDVADYTKIKDITDELFKPICDGFNTECGPDCHGFCGCGKCLCPTCDGSGSTCHDITCKADGSSSTGCVTSEIACPIKDDVCTWYTCDGSKPDAERCSPVYNQCEDKKKANPGTCREVLCSTSVTGGCYVKLNDALCQTTFGNACEDFECTPEGETVPEEYKETGCRLKSNKTADKEEELESEGKVCFKATCNKITGVVGEESTCTSAFPKCFTSMCTKDGNSYTCKDTEKNRPSNTECTTYKCSEDASKGWVVAEEKNEATCTAEFQKDDVNATKCMNVYCDPKEGCKMEKIATCNYKCTDEKIAECVAEGAKPTWSSVDHCVLGACKAVETPAGSGNWDLDCDFETTWADCTKTMAEELEKLNKADPSKCYTPMCGSNGRCTYTFTEAPAEYEETKCMKPECQRQSDGTWDWAYVPTEVNKTCISDACSHRECIADEGCHEEDICMVKTTECVTYSCDVSGSTAQCVGVSAKFEETECTKEVCENDKKVMVTKNLTEVCNPPDKCYVAKCVDGKCEYEPKSPEGDDPCTVYTCDPATGLFSETPKCYDGLYCTEDQCNVFGECKFNPLSCANELDMDGYPCFEPACKEGDGEHRCVRKLLRDAYIDVCGNCIQESDQSGSMTDSELTSAKSVDLLECTNAPAKPILTEGLAAASIALIILAAVLIGAGIAASGVIGTKTLIERAKGANNQSAHSNPLFEGNEAEMTNPAFVGENN